MTLPDLHAFTPFLHRSEEQHGSPRLSSDYRTERRRRAGRAVRPWPPPEAETEDSARQKTAQPQRSQSGRHLGPVEPLPQRRGLGKGVRRLAEADSTATPQFQGHLADGADTLAKCITFDLDVNRVGDRLGALRRPEDLRGPDQRRLSADDGPLHAGRQPGGQAVELHQSRDPRHSLGEDGRVPAGPGVGPLQAAADAHPPLQAAHARREGRAAAGDAGRDGRRRPARSSAN